MNQIDRLNLEGYANLEHWVAELDKRIEGILLQRLSHIINVWCTEFTRDDDGDTRRDSANPRDLTSKRRDKRKDEKVSKVIIEVITPVVEHVYQQLEGGLALKPIVHEIRIQNQVIFLDPPIEYARQTWLHQLHEWLGMFVCA